VVVLTMARRSNTGASGCGLLIVGLLAIALVVLIIKWALITAAILAVPFGIWWVLDRSKQRERTQEMEANTARRVEIEGRAVVDAAGGCGWCGSPIAHSDEAGQPVAPREFHRDEIDQTLAVDS
jgi:hypothetical protein